jgi:hypothetical protein
VKTFIQYINEERKNSDFMTSLKLFNIDPKNLDNAIEKTPSVFAQALYGDKQIGASAFDVKKIGKNYAMKNRSVFGDLTYTDHVPSKLNIKTVVTPTFVDYLKTQGRVGAEKYNDFLKGKAK